jgi:uncharacterized protein (DUF1015 family)
LSGEQTKPIRGIRAAIHAVQTGPAAMAFLLEPLRIEDIEQDARNGLTLPPKSAGFFPKLAAGLVMHRPRH